MTPTPERELVERLWVVRVRTDSGFTFHEFRRKLDAEMFYGAIRSRPASEVRGLGFAHLTRKQLEACRG